MPQARSFYQGHLFNEGHTWWFIRERIGQDLRERYEVPKELPRELVLDGSLVGSLAEQPEAADL
jgi:hypothetical protein